MSYRLGTYAGHHTLYDELDPAMAAARMAYESPISDEERALQWALLQEIEDFRRKAQEPGGGAFSLTDLQRAQVMAFRCGYRRCWCATNPGGNPDRFAGPAGYTPEYLEHVWRFMEQMAMIDKQTSCPECIHLGHVSSHVPGYFRHYPCCSLGPCTAPKNETGGNMYWLDLGGTVQTIASGDLIPHYTWITKIWHDSKWHDYNPKDEIKASQDACCALIGRMRNQSKHSNQVWESKETRKTKETTRFGGFFIAWGKDTKDKKDKKKGKKSKKSKH